MATNNTYIIENIGIEPSESELTIPVASGTLYVYERDADGNDDLLGTIAVVRDQDKSFTFDPDPFTFSRAQYDEGYEAVPAIYFRLDMQNGEFKGGTKRDGNNGAISFPDSPNETLKERERSLYPVEYPGDGGGNGEEDPREWSLNFSDNPGSVGKLTFDLRWVVDADQMLAGTVTPVGEGFNVTVDADVVDNLGSRLKDVKLKPPGTYPTEDQALWIAIRQRTDALGFANYRAFIERTFCAPGSEGTDAAAFAASGVVQGGDLPQRGGTGNVYMSRVDAYTQLRVATDAFLLMNACGPVSIEGGESRFGRPRYDAEAEARRTYDTVPLGTVEDRLRSYLKSHLGVSDKLPYVEQVIDTNFPDGLLAPKEGGGYELKNAATPFCYGIYRADPCMIELIWSFWHECGMLVQAANAVSLRFQNRRTAPRDPLANLALDPLRPLNNLLWGHVQTESTRLTVPRRVYEYVHQYGLTLEGKAVPAVQAVDSRTKFLESFHNLLYRTVQFYAEDSDMTKLANGYTLLNALKEVHMLLAQGAHNQFGDLPWTARSEMMTMQFMLARDEMREFLRGPLMVPYQEAWMGQVDTMNKLQGWTDVPINYFRDLGVFGEQLLLSIRYGDWSRVTDDDRAKNWARYWSAEVRGYLHAYQTVTGVDLSAEPVNTQAAALRAAQPAKLIAQRAAALRGDGGPASAARRLPGGVASETPALPPKAAPPQAEPSAPKRLRGRRRRR